MIRRASIQVIDDPNDPNLAAPPNKKGNAEPPPPPNNAQALSPLVDFEIGDSLKSKNPADLLQDLPVVIEVNDFTDESVKKFDAEMARAMRTGQTQIPILIDSYGGNVYSLFRMLDTVRAAKARGFTVVTIAAGKAMSCGAILLTVGDARYAGEDAIVMIHDVSSWTYGKLPDIVADAKHTEYLGKRLYSLLDQACRKDAGYWYGLVHANGHADLYVTAPEALSHGLITHIGMPHFVTKVSTRFEAR